MYQDVRTPKEIENEFYTFISHFEAALKVVTLASRSFNIVTALRVLDSEEMETETAAAQRVYTEKIVQLRDRLLEAIHGTHSPHFDYNVEELLRYCDKILSDQRPGRLRRELEEARDKQYELARQACALKFVDEKRPGTDIDATQEEQKVANAE